MADPGDYELVEATPGASEAVNDVPSMDALWKEIGDLDDPAIMQASAAVKMHANVVYRHVKSGKLYRLVPPAKRSD